MAITTKPISISLKEYGRGLAGGLLFSLPMLYTMELWWTGFIVKPFPLLTYFIVGIFLLMVYNRYVGIRRDHSLWEGFIESMEEMGLGILLTALILWITHRITGDMSVQEISGKIIVEAVTVAIGISVGKAQLGMKSDEEEEEEVSDDKMADKKSKSGSNLLRTLNLSLCGAIIIAGNVAPTEEIMVIALEAPAFKLLIIALLSIGIGGAVLYYINFSGSKKWVSKPPTTMDIILGTVIMYAVSLAASAFMLWFFNRFVGLSLYGIVAETIVLSFPAALGASAGRLLIQ